MPFQFRKEAIEEDLNTNFPSQGQGNPPLFYSLSEVVVPTYSINNVAEGSGLAQNLQTAWDFSTGSVANKTGTTATVISNTGFWKIQANLTNEITSAVHTAELDIFDGVTAKTIWSYNFSGGPGDDAEGITGWETIVFLRSGDSLRSVCSASQIRLVVTYRQIADVNGNLVNPLGFSAA